MTDVIFGSGAIILWVLIAAIFLVPQLNTKFYNLIKNDKQLALKLVLGFSLIALLGSLWYSEIIGHEPCKLCWYQRIFMYPIVLLSFLALVKKDLSILWYIKGLAIVGSLISIFHIVEQRLPQAGLSCGSVGQAVSCDSLWVNAFGLVTIPTMALTIFIAILTTTYFYEKKK